MFSFLLIWLAIGVALVVIVVLNNRSSGHSSLLTREFGWDSSEINDYRPQNPLEVNATELSHTPVNSTTIFYLDRHGHVTTNPTLFPLQ